MTPHKVLVKMVFSRYEALWDGIREVNYWREWQKAIIDFPVTRANLRTPPKIFYYGLRSLSESLMTALKRPDVTEEVLDEVWNLLQINKVMTD